MTLGDFDRLFSIKEVLKGYSSTSLDYEICSEFIGYLEKTEDTHIKAHGVEKSNILNRVIQDFGYPHRYSPQYIKGRYAKLYQLEEWYKLNPDLPITFLSFTIRHKAKRVYEFEDNSSQWFYEGFMKLQEGKQLLFREMRRIHKKLPYIMVVEPHEDGFPHYHMILFSSFSDDEKNKLRALWEKWGLGSFEHGLDFDERSGKGKIKSMRNYLMKYMSKSFIDYDSKFDKIPWSKEQLLFNAVAWKYHFRTWCASRNLSKVMAYNPDKTDEIDWYKTTLGSVSRDDVVLWSDKDKIDENKKSIEEMKVLIDSFFYVLPRLI